MAREYHVVYMLPAITASFSSLPDGTVGVAYTGDANAVGGTGSYTFTKQAGPSWMSVNSSTGAITGTPDAIGSGITVTVRATDTDTNFDDVTDTIDVIVATTYDTLNPSDKASHITLSGGDRTATGSSGSWGNAQSVTAHDTTGKFYVEMTYLVKPSFGTMLGVCPATMPTTTFIGSASGGASIYADGANSIATWVNGVYSGTIAGHDVDVGSGFLKLAVDCVNGKAWLGTNAGWVGGGDPAAGTNPTYTFSAATPMQIGASCNNTDSATINFGNAAFSGAVPSGFTAGWTT